MAELPLLPRWRREVPEICMYLYVGTYVQYVHMQVPSCQDLDSYAAGLVVVGREGQSRLLPEAK